MMFLTAIYDKETNDVDNESTLKVAGWDKAALDCWDSHYWLSFGVGWRMSYLKWPLVGL